MKKKQDHQDEEPSFRNHEQARKGHPSETQVKRGRRFVHGDKELEEKLGRNDRCPCGSGRRFWNCCLRQGRFDGSLRNYFFPRMSAGANVELRSICSDTPHRIT